MHARDFRPYALAVASQRCMSCNEKTRHFRPFHITLSITKFATCSIKKCICMRGKFQIQTIWLPRVFVKMVMCKSIQSDSSYLMHLWVFVTCWQNACVQICPYFGCEQKHTVSSNPKPFTAIRWHHAIRPHLRALNTQAPINTQWGCLQPWVNPKWALWAQAPGSSCPPINTRVSVTIQYWCCCQRSV